MTKSDRISEVKHRETNVGVASAGTEGASRVIDVLLVFLDESNEVGVSQVSRTLGISKAVVHRIFRSLVSKNMIEQNEQTKLYALGPAAVALGARAFRDSNLRKEATPILKHLRDETGETVTLSELLGHERAYIEQFPSPQEIKMLVKLGCRFPLHAGSSSKVILSFLSPEEQAEIIDGYLAKFTPETVIDGELLSQELVTIRQQGFAVSRGERQRGAGAVAAPVFNHRGNVIGAISVCGPVERFDQQIVDSLIPLVTQAARFISNKLGAVAPNVTFLPESHRSDFSEFNES